ncbi:MAG: phosphate ABC transporter permease subunit PstC [Solirubrobacteraceae bacterium]
MLDRLREPWTDRRAERTLGALACLVLVLIVLMLIFVAVRAWPSFANNSFAWFGARGDVDQQIGHMVNTGGNPAPADFRIGVWSLIWATLLTTGLAVIAGLAFALAASIFIVEFAPPRLRRVVVPVVRLLAAVPSVIFGLIGILVLVPFINDHLVSPERKQSVQYVINLSGTGLLVSVVILTVMITPIMIAITVDALYAVPKGWREGALALGANRFRAIWTVSVRAARPAIIAGAVLACARALGEAIMLSMVSGSKGFSPNPADGLTFIFEPLRTLASTIVEDAESLNAPTVQASVYAFALLLLFSSLVLSLAAWAAKQPLKKYGVQA